MAIKNSDQLQIRIDSKTKREAKEIFNKLGIDLSSAIKLFLHQTINVKNIPFEIRDENGLSLKNAEILKESIISAEINSTKFKSASALIKDALKE